MTAASKSGILRARVDDLVAGLRHPGENERLLFAQGLLRRQRIDPEGSQDPRQPGVFLYNNLLRVMKEEIRLGERAAKGLGYVVQLPREVSGPWPPELIAYWKSLGDQMGSAVPPIRPPAIFPGLEARAVSIRPEVVRACEPVESNSI